VTASPRGLVGRAKRREALERQGWLSAKLRAYEQAKIEGCDFEQALPGPKGESQGGDE